MIYTINEYQQIKHKMYNTLKVYSKSKNVYHIYKNHITEYSGIYNRSYGCEFTLKCPFTGFKITRSKKSSIINYLNKKLL